MVKKHIFIKKYILFFGKNKNQLLAPNFIDAEGRFTASLREGYSIGRLIEDLFPDPMSINRKVAQKLSGSKQSEAFQWLIGACVFTSKEFLAEIGGLDENYFLYMEDVVLGMRVQGKGSVASLSSPIVHLGAQSTNKPSSFIAKELADARLKYLRDNFGFWSWVMTKSLLLVASVTKNPLKR